MNTISIRLPHSLHKAVKVLAKKENISIDAFITLAVSEKLSTLKTEELLKNRAKHASREKFLNVLMNAPNVIPDECDIL